MIITRPRLIYIYKIETAEKENRFYFSPVQRQSIVSVRVSAPGRQDIRDTGLEQGSLAVRSHQLIYSD